MVRPRAWAVLRVDDQLKLHGALDGQVAWFGPPEIFPHISSGAAKLVNKACPIGHEAPSLRHFPPPMHGWQPPL